MELIGVLVVNFDIFVRGHFFPSILDQHSPDSVNVLVVLLSSPLHERNPEYGAWEHKLGNQT